MFRIYRPALVLLACILLCISLIAARPQPVAPAPAIAPPFPARFADRLVPLDIRPTPAAVAGSAAPAYLPYTPGEDIASDTRAARARARPQRAPAAAPAPVRIAGSGPRMPGTLVVQTNRLDLYIGKSTFSADQIAEIAPLLEQLLRKNEARFETKLDHRVSIGFYRAALAPGRGVRGMAYTDSGQVEIFYRSYEDIERAATVVAHELGHHLEAQRYGEQAQRRADTILHEGMATWIAGHRWLAMCDAPTWHERARQLRAAGVPLRLLTAERFGADNAYELWASFVHFLTLRYGWEKLDALYISGRGRTPGSADYQQVLGKSLDELADEWRAWIGE